jgi:rod shape-determining protein MreD
MRYVLAALLLLMAALVQASVMPAFPVFGVVPNLVLALAVCWTVVRGQQEAMIVVPMAGLCLGLVGSQPLGVTLLATMPVVLFSELRALRLTPSDFLLTVVIVFLSSMVYEMVLLVALRLEGESVGWFAAFLRVVLPTGIVSVLFTPPLYWLVRSRSEGLRRRIRAFA